MLCLPAVSEPRLEMNSQWFEGDARLMKNGAIASAPWIVWVARGNQRPTSSLRSVTYFTWDRLFNG